MKGDIAPTSPIENDALTIIRTLDAIDHGWVIAWLRQGIWIIDRYSRPGQKRPALTLIKNGH